MRMRPILIIIIIHLTQFLNLKYFNADLFGQSSLYGNFSNLFSVDASNEISVSAVGDVMLDSWVIPLLKENGSTYPFKNVSPYLISANITIANLEAAFTHDGEIFKKNFNFKVPPEYASGLKESGIDVVTLANNHILDFGETGLISTLKTLDEIGILHCGAGMNLDEAHQPAVMELNGKKIAFFGYSMTFPKEFFATQDSSGTAYPQPDLMNRMLMKWEDLVDFTIVSFHWGAEKISIPKDYQIYFAHLAIDSGADLVLGHHPHVLQGIEIYKNRLIAYSLGNFVFGSYSKHAVDSIILKAYLDREGLVYARCIPINVDNRQIEFQPAVADVERKVKVISKLQEISMHLNGGKNIISNEGLILGDWGSFYNDWLLDTVISSYWYIFSGKDFVNSHGLKKKQELFN